MNCERRRPACNSFNAYTGIIIMDGEKKAYTILLQVKRLKSTKKKNNSYLQRNQCFLFHMSCHTSLRCSGGWSDIIDVRHSLISIIPFHLSVKFSCGVIFVMLTWKLVIRALHTKINCIFNMCIVHV